MRRRIIRWIIIAIAVPIIANVLHESGKRMERTRGPESKAAKGLKVAGSAVRFVR